MLFEKATKFDEISILLLTNNLCSVFPATVLNFNEVLLLLLYSVLTKNSFAGFFFNGFQGAPLESFTVCTRNSKF